MCDEFTEARHVSRKDPGVVDPQFAEHLSVGSAVGRLASLLINCTVMPVPVLAGPRNGPRPPIESMSCLRIAEALCAFVVLTLTIRIALIHSADRRPAFDSAKIPELVPSRRNISKHSAVASSFGSIVVTPIALRIRYIDLRTASRKARLAFSIKCRRSATQACAAGPWRQLRHIHRKHNRGAVRLSSMISPKILVRYEQTESSSLIYTTTGFD